MSTLANHIFKLHVIQHEQKLNEDHVVIEHLSENAPAENEPIRTPPMSAVDANWIRKLQPQTKLYWNSAIQQFSTDSLLQLNRAMDRKDTDRYNTMFPQQAAPLPQRAQRVCRA